MSDSRAIVPLANVARKGVLLLVAEGVRERGEAAGWLWVLRARPAQVLLNLEDELALRPPSRLHLAPSFSV
jgi:hypothetical protein